MRIFIICLLLTTSWLYSQESTWYTFDLDSIVAFDMPAENIHSLDTILKGIKFHQLYMTTENGSTFIVQKSKLEEENMDKNLSNLPYNIKSLNEYYKGVAKGLANSLPYSIYEEKEVKFNTLNGYQVILTDSEKKPRYASYILIINKYLYAFSYLNSSQLYESEKEYFFTSVSFNSHQKINQFSGASPAKRKGYLFGRVAFYIILIVGAIVFFIRTRKKKVTKNS